MKAWTYRRYGSPDVLRWADVETPSPKDDEVVIRIRAAGLNAADWHMMRGEPKLVRLFSGLRRPRKRAIVGSDIAGVVESVGAGVTRLHPGDEVFAEVGAGGCAELVAVASRPCRPSATTAASKPVGTSS
jgi:NADPH:quinone reductase-like Zn-dependent oxidoreductase